MPLTYTQHLTPPQVGEVEEEPTLAPTEVKEHFVFVLFKHMDFRGSSNQPWIRGSAPKISHELR